MNLEQIMDRYERQDQKHIVACRQLGAYSALLNYAINTLNGQSTSSPESVAEYIRSRHEELLEEQSLKLFPNTQIA